MDSDFSQNCDITFISECNCNEDHIDRAHKSLRELQEQNDAIRRQMEMIKANPKSFIRPVRDELVDKINQVREENDSLKRMVEKSKAPVYSEMTKKKIVHQDASPYRQSMKSSYRPRNPLEQIDSNYDKQDGRSTCLNYGKNSQIKTNRNYVSGANDEQSRQAITNEIRLLIKRADAFEDELGRVSKKENDQLKKKQNLGEEEKEELSEIAKYKKKLINLLQKLRNRELAMADLVKTYREMHQETMEKLMQASQTLEQLRAAKVSDDVDQKYAEVLELQQRLQYINSQLEEMDESRWLEQICGELAQAVRRMGVDIPKIENTRDLIDELCSILVEGHILSRKDSQNKLSMLKHYHQEEKKNNSKYIVGLKAKEQALGRRLIDMQMEK